MALDPAVLERKREKLMDDLSGLDTLLVAFSGGVDSAFLLSVAHEVLGEKVLGVTAASPIHPLEERETASRFAETHQIRHLVINSKEMTLPEFIENTPDRCYHCKKVLIGQLTQVAGESGIRHMAHGANRDDLRDFRPGFRAADEAGLLSPLVNAGLHKSEIRLLAKQMGLSVWDRPAAACLATRLPYGSPITERKLRMVETAEQCLKNLGFRELRVRYHGSVARIELGGEAFASVMDVPVREEIVKRFQALGFTHISLDLEGYVSGKMNRELVY